MLARLCSKSFRVSFSSTWTKNFQMYKLCLEKAEDPEVKLSTSFASQKKNSRKTSTSVSLTMLKPLIVWITTNCGKCLSYLTIALISHASRVTLKILQARLQTYVNQELPDVQAGFRKGRGTRDQIAKILWIIEKAREFQKNIYYCFIDYPKAFDCVDHNTLENS